MLLNGMHGPITEKQREILDTITLSANQLLYFINNLLDKAQLESGKMTLLPVEFSPSNVLSEVEVTVQPLIENKNLKIKSEITEDVPARLIADPNRLIQILSNLVGNAIKFTNEGEIRMRLFCPDETHWALQVSDTGSGIPKDAQAHIFDAFWQVDGSTTRKVNRGVGLGLSIVSQLTNLMNGKIIVESEEGHGSTFTVILPMELPQGKPVNV
jgi:signal transduction histidine kinase